MLRRSVKRRHDGVPSELSTGFQIVRRHPHLLFLRDALLDEVGFAPIDERQGIGFPIKFWEIHLLESGRPVVVVFIGGRGPGARYRVGRMLLLLECIDRGLRVLHCRHGVLVRVARSAMVGHDGCGRDSGC